MKKILIIVFLLANTLVLFGCNDDKLHETVRYLVENSEGIVTIERGEMKVEVDLLKEIVSKKYSFFEKSKIEKEMRIFLEAFEIYTEYHGIELIIIGDNE